MLAAVAAGSLIAFSMLADRSTTDLLMPRVKPGQLTADVPPVVLQGRSEPERDRPKRQARQTVAVAAVPVPDEVLPARISNDDLTGTTDTTDAPQARDRTNPDGSKDRGPVARRDESDGKSKKPGKEWKHDNDHYARKAKGHFAKPAKPAAAKPAHPAKPKPQGVAKGHDKSNGKGHKKHPHH